MDILDLNFQDIIMDAPVPTCIFVGREMVVELANKKMIAVWGKTTSVNGKKLIDILPEFEGQPFFQLLDNVFTSGIPYHASEQKAMLEKDGVLQQFWFNFTYQPLVNSEGKVYAILNMATDVTYQVLTKQKLAHAEEKLQNVIQVANLGTWEIDPITKTVLLNKTLMQWRGLTDNNNIKLDELLSKTENSDKINLAIDKALKDPNFILDVEYNLIDKNSGEVRRLHTQGKTFFDEEKKAIILAGISQDVTLQRINEADLAEKIASKTKDLENANTELINLNDNLEQFVYVASHDLQEPLRKINIFSEMLQNNFPSLSDEQNMYLTKIEKSAKRMSLLISDLLSFSRLSAKEKIYEKTDINEIIKNILIDYELLINQKNAVISIDEIPIIEAIPLQMNQLFFNIIGNALKFTKTNNDCNISISNNLLSKNEIENYKLKDDRNYCNIMIKDNGIGFNQKYAVQIFEIFQRLHGKHEYEGTGIGLSLARKIVVNHGGHISATSTQNEGANFNIILPLTQ